MINEFIRRAILKQTSQQDNRNPRSEELSPEKLLQKQPLIPEDVEVTVPEKIGSFAFQPDQKFPKDFAILYVESVDDRYFVYACNAQQTALHTEPDMPPGLSFSEQQTKRRKPSEIRGIIREFSAKNSKARQIRRWINTLRKMLQEQYKQDLSCIVIQDRTDFEIPWEMLNLSEHEHLGSSIVVVRWQDIQNFEDDFDHNENLKRLEVQSDYCQGDIIAYTNTKELKGVTQEVSLLKEFNAICFENINKFLRHLHKVKTEIGLVFLASHGFLSDDDVFDTTLGESEREHRISLSELCGWDFSFLQTSRSLVFMNACHSGRLRTEQQYTGKKYRIGLATFFLERGARGVIGTMGWVEDQYASRIAQNFLEECRQASCLPIATVLRNIRARALKELQADMSDENWFLFFFTFMYVYYGNPMTVLRLKSSEEQQNV